MELDEELVVEGHSLIRDQNLSETEKKDVQRAILLQEPESIQNKLVENPTKAMEDLKKVQEIVQNDEITPEDKENLKKEIL